MDDDDDEEPRQPTLDRRPPDYFPDSFWPPTTPALPHLHLEPDHISAYFEEQEGGIDDAGFMLGEFRWKWNSPADDDRACRFGELDPIGEGCFSTTTSSSSSSMLSSFPSTSVSISAATEESIEELPDAEKSDDKPSPEIA